VKSRHLDPAGYLSEKTIVALSTPSGGALSVVRMSGTRAHEILKRISEGSGNFEERKAKRVWLKNLQGKTIDDAVVVSYVSPRSFTGEDLVEISIHGSSRIAQNLIEAIVECGARPALAGEFSFRAVKNGKLQLSQAEAIKEVIAADNDLSLELALEKLSGSQHRFIQDIHADLMQLVTLAEAGIDFSDQDLDEVSLPTLKKRLSTSLALLDRLGSSFSRGKRLSDGVPVAFLGLPNAGKSSFFNALLGEDRSIVSEIAGTTRDVIREKISLKEPVSGATIGFRLADTAGIRKSDDQIEGIGVSRSIQSGKDADIVVLLVDGTQPRLPEVGTILQSVKPKQVHHEYELLMVVSKLDQLSPAEQGKVTHEIKAWIAGSGRSSSVVWVSSTTLEGVDRAASELARMGSMMLQRNPGEVVLTQFEQVRAVEKAVIGLKRAESTTDIVLFATEVRHAMNELGPLLGQTVPDDILGKIFSDFCIGK
jgi:tRNA modification GTPase